MGRNPGQAGDINSPRSPGLLKESRMKEKHVLEMCGKAVMKQGLCGGGEGRMRPCLSIRCTERLHK